MKGKIVIAGGTGFIGRYLSDRFKRDAYTVVIVGRSGQGVVPFQDKEALMHAVDGAEMVINLAGKPITSRFTEQNKKELIESRIETTQAVGEAISSCSNKPRVWFNASGAHIYGTGDDVAHTEDSPEDHCFFLAHMAAEWERAFFHYAYTEVRQIALRISIVLGENGGVLEPFVQLTKWCLGGTQGSGEQWFSWIHIDDFYRSLIFLHKQAGFSGPVNLCSPHPVRNKELMRTLRQVLHRPIGLPAPAFAIKIGTSVMGIESDLILKSLYVHPARLQQEGFRFAYPDIRSALLEILS
ncbi:MAG: TIGR01777 family oxidoreductase [Chitinophagaceae bacterium]